MHVLRVAGDPFEPGWAGRTRCTIVAPASWRRNTEPLGFHACNFGNTCTGGKGDTVCRLSLPHEDMPVAQSLVLGIGTAAPVLVESPGGDMLALPGHGGREAGCDGGMRPAEDMLWSDEGFAGTVVGLLDESAVVAGHCEV
jgi:hypothetical protein